MKLKLKYTLRVDVQNVNDKSRKQTLYYVENYL